MTTLTRERLLEALAYDPLTGVFTRRIAVGKLKVGARFGSRNGHGYLHGWLDGRNLYRCHRLAWFYVYGVWPNGMLDHIDGDKANNRIANLRESNHTENGWNVHRRQAGSDQSLPAGVTRNGSGFLARIRSCGRTYRLGTFRTPEAAGAAYLDAKALYHEVFY